jgi:hypothetical protein
MKGPKRVLIRGGERQFTIDVPAPRLLHEIFAESEIVTAAEQIPIRRPAWSKSALAAA